MEDSQMAKTYMIEVDCAACAAKNIFWKEKFNAKRG